MRTKRSLVCLALLALALFAAGAVRADTLGPSGILWGAVQTATFIPATTDLDPVSVLTPTNSGVYTRYVNAITTSAHSWGGVNITVNGVKFYGYTSIAYNDQYPGGTNYVFGADPATEGVITVANVWGGWGSYGNGGATPYDWLICPTDAGNGGGNIHVSGLVVSNKYQIQLWGPSWNAGWLTYYDGIGLNAIGNGSAQYMVGTFTATNSTMDIALAYQGTAPTAISLFRETLANDPPVAEAGPDQTVEATYSATPVASVSLAAADANPLGHTLTFSWDEGTTNLASTRTANVNLGLGTNTITLTVNDLDTSLSATDTVVITVVPQRTAWNAVSVWTQDPGTDILTSGVTNGVHYSTYVDAVTTWGSDITVNGVTFYSMPIAGIGNGFSAGYTGTQNPAGSVRIKQRLQTWGWDGIMTWNRPTTGPLAAGAYSDLVGKMLYVQANSDPTPCVTMEGLTPGTKYQIQVWAPMNWYRDGSWNYQGGQAVWLDGKPIVTGRCATYYSQGADYYMDISTGGVVGGPPEDYWGNTFYVRGSEILTGYFTAFTDTVTLPISGNILPAAISLFKEYVPSLVNQAASGFTSTSAVMNATLGGLWTNYNVTAYWNTTSGGTNAANWTNSVSVGSFTNVATDISATATGLTASTTYYFTFRATNEVSDMWATNVLTFSVGAAPNAPAYISPASNAMNVATNAKLVWANAYLAESYQVYFWKTSDSKPGSPSASVGTTNWVPALIMGSNYNWQVVASNAFGMTSGPVWTFGVTPLAVTNGLQLWFDASQITGKNNGDTVTTWPDMSGNNHDTTGTINSSPTYTSSVPTLNNKPAVQFDENGYSLDNLGASFPNGAANLFMVIKLNDNAYTVFQTRSNDARDMNGGAYPGMFRNNRIEGYRAAGQMPTLGQHLWVVESNGTHWEWWDNGNSWGSVGANWNAGDDWRIGNSANGEALTGWIAEILVYNRSLSAPEKACVSDYLATKYATPASFIWTNTTAGAIGKWTNAANWNPSSGYPGQVQSGDSAWMTQSAEGAYTNVFDYATNSIAGLTISNANGEARLIVTNSTLAVGYNSIALGQGAVLEIDNGGVVTNGAALSALSGGATVYLNSGGRLNTQGCGLGDYCTGTVMGATSPGGMWNLGGGDIDLTGYADSLTVNNVKVTNCVYSQVYYGSSLTITNGADVTYNCYYYGAWNQWWDMRIGWGSGGNSVNVVGSTVRFARNDGVLYLGLQAGNNTMTIGAGGVVTNVGVFQVGSDTWFDLYTVHNGLIVKDGGKLFAAGGLYMAVPQHVGCNDNYIVVTNGGQIVSVGGAFVTGGEGPSVRNTCVISGGGSLWNLSGGNFSIGSFSGSTSNTLTIAAGGSMTNVGTVTLSGTDNRITMNSGTLWANNAVTVATNSLITMTNDAMLSAGVVTVDAGGLIAIDVSTMLVTNSVTVNGLITMTNSTMLVTNSVTIGARGLIALSSGAEMRVNDGLNIDAGGAVDFAKRSTAIMYIRKGSAGGTIDTIEEVSSAIYSTPPLITLGGAHSTRDEFLVREMTVDSTTYVVTTLGNYGTVLIIR